MKKYLAANLESLVYSINKTVENDKKEEVHEFLRAYCNLFTNNVYNSKDYTFTNLKRLRNDESIVVIPGNKDSCVIVMDKSDYVEKLNGMIDDGIAQGVYQESNGTTLIDLKHSQDFLRFSKYEHYTEMWPTSNAPAKLYGTAKTHKFHDITKITMEDLKFRPILAQTGTCTYNVAQVISNYPKPLYLSNDYIINNTQGFSGMIQNQPPITIDDEYISHDVESLFTNVPIQEAIDYILEEIYDNKRSR